MRPESEILAHADADDRDGDGISGRPNRVWSVRAGAKVLGRFGWKANQPSIEEQTAGAFRGDIGMTSSPVPGEDCPSVQTQCLAAPSGGSTELDEAKLVATVAYGRTLAVPARRRWDAPDVRRGERLFAEAQCASCHLPKLHTGAASPTALANQTIRPFTDLLLHDMGPDLADERPDFEADGREWRTPPLWGIGLLETVSGHELLMHDGRARGFAEAILWHRGEGGRSREAFRAMPKADRDALLSFLRSLYTRASMKTSAYAVHSAGSAFAPFSLERRAVGPRDVAIEILFCGICHSDVHQARNEWGAATFPMVPGHEIVARDTTASYVLPSRIGRARWMRGRSATKPTGEVWMPSRWKLDGASP